MLSGPPDHWDDEVDVLVLGFGGAGAAAAIEATERGATALVIERFNGGGATRLSGGIYYAGGGTDLQKAAGYDDTPDQMYEYLRRETGGEAVADEVLHARIGRDWYVKDFENVAAAAEYGSACWDKVVSDWKQWRKDGLTEHRNWWPDLYREVCKHRGEEPDPRVLAYDQSYAATRADVRRISDSG